MKYIAKQWDSFLEKVVPKNAHITQVTETRKAFYAGAGALFYELLSVSSLEKGSIEPTEADLQKMSDIEVELQEFLEEIRPKSKVN